MIYLNKFHEKNDLGSLEGSLDQEINSLGFLDEEGGSEYINQNEAISDVVKTTFNDFVKEKFQSPAFRKRIGLGLFEMTQEQLDTEVKKFAEYDKDTGTIKVKDAQALIDEGVLSVFEQDPFTERIILDRAAEITGGEPTEEAKAQVLVELLQPFNTGTVVDKTNVKTAREAVDFKERSQAKTTEESGKWLESARSGDPEAWDFLKGTKMFGGEIHNVEVNPKEKVVFLTIRKPGTLGDKGIREEVFYGEGSTNEELLKFFRAAPKKGVPFGENPKPNLKSIQKPKGLKDLMNLN